MPCDQTEIIKGHCPRCNGERKAYVRGRHEHRENATENGLVYSVTTGMVLECCGCEAIYFKEDFWFSEDVEDAFEPNGEHYYAPVVTTTYWPAPTKRQPPEWIDRVRGFDKDGTLANLISELYTALNSGLPVLAAIGARTVFDRTMELLHVDPALTFEKKLDALVGMGKIGVDERKTLDALTEAGNAAAHRGWKPSPDELSTIMDVIEAFLHRSFILGDAMSKLKAAVPPRQKRSKSKKSVAGT